MNGQTLLYRLNKKLGEHGHTLALGGFTGILIAVLLFYYLPVVTMQGKMIDRTENSVTIFVWGEKHRGRCKFLELTAYVSKNGLLHSASSNRLDMVSDGSTKPAGFFSVGYWLITPTAGANKVFMYVTHSCGEGDVRVTKIAEVVL